MSGTSFESRANKGLHEHQKKQFSVTPASVLLPDALLLQEVQKSYLGSGFLVGKGQVHVAHVPCM